MDYTRYSKEALDALPLGSAALQRRMTELAIDVQFELHAVLNTKLKEVASRLNAMGHELRETESSRPECIDFAQGEKPNPFYLSCDPVISSGYLGTSACDAPIDEHVKWQKEWRAEK
jgi:hypothetical protein